MKSMSSNGTTSHDLANLLLAAALACAAGVVACSSDSSGTTTTPDGGGGGNGDGGGGGAGGTCSAAREKLLTPIATASAAEVLVLSEAGGAKTLYVDASAGGTQAAAQNPRVYLSLETGARVDVSDVAAASSQAWDIAIKRPVIFTNSGDGGPGQGGAVYVDKAFDSVTAADADGKTFLTEKFFDADCNASLDQTGAVKTALDGWYDYNPAGNVVTPKSGTWIIKGASAKSYKLQVLQYYATSDGGVGQAGGRYTLKIGAL